MFQCLLWILRSVVLIRVRVLLSWFLSVPVWRGGEKKEQEEAVLEVSFCRRAIRFRYCLLKLALGQWQMRGVGGSGGSVSRCPPMTVCYPILCVCESWMAFG